MSAGERARRPLPSSEDGVAEFSALRNQSQDLKDWDTRIALPVWYPQETGRGRGGIWFFSPIRNRHGGCVMGRKFISKCFGRMAHIYVSLTYCKAVRMHCGDKISRKPKFALVQRTRNQATVSVRCGGRIRSRSGHPPVRFSPGLLIGVAGQDRKVFQSYEGPSFRSGTPSDRVPALVYAMQPSGLGGREASLPKGEVDQRPA